MRIISRKKLVSFYTKHADAETALEEWYEKTDQADWSSFAELRKTFNSADLVGNKRIVFNIKGNDYRLIALVLFNARLVYVRFVGSHAEYDRLSAEQVKTI